MDESIARLTQCFSLILANLYKSVQSQLFLDKLREAVFCLLKAISATSQWSLMPLYSELLLIYLVCDGKKTMIDAKFVNTNLKKWISKEFV